MIDIDFFKLYNDHYGHQQGDDCLIKVANLLSGTLRRVTDVIARYGGEEFTILLPFTPIEGARFKAIELIKNLNHAQLPHSYSSISSFVTCSIGISSSKLKASSPGELIKQADDALYQAKAGGRNKYCVYHNI